jgi:hypothetical protein
MFGLSKEVRAKIEKHSSNFQKILKNSLKYKKEDILIVSDFGKKENNLATMLSYGYYHAALKKGLSVSLLHQEVKKGFMSADKHVVDAISDFGENNIIILALSNKLGRFGENKSFRTFCKNKGHRFLSATGLGDVNSSYYDLFLDTMCVSYKRMEKRSSKIKKLWDKAKTIQVKSPNGTNITVDVQDMVAIENIGKYHSPGQGGNMPSGEVYIPPKGFYGVSGKLVIDGSLKLASGAMLVDKPVTLIVKEGRIEKIEGKHAKLLQDTYEKFEDRSKYPSRVRRACELGIGINPASVLIGSMIMDEKVAGTGHLAFGSNYWFGGEIRSVYHGDQVFKDPTYYVDGKKMNL